MFPPDGSLWPDESGGAMLDGCATGAEYKALLIGYLVLVFLTAGALASRIAEHPSRTRGALVNAVVFASTLVVLTIQEESDFSVIPTFVLNIASIAGAAGLGFLGGGLVPNPAPKQPRGRRVENHARLRLSVRRER